MYRWIKEIKCGEMFRIRKKDTSHKEASFFLLRICVYILAITNLQ